MSVHVPSGLPRLAPRSPDAHKGTFGTVLAAAGSPGMTGAAVLCGGAALRGGAGLVRVACPADVLPTVAAGNPCYTTAPLPVRTDGTYTDAAAEEITRLAADADVLAIGPGFGNRPDVAALVRTVLAGVPELPVVVDADALNVLAPFPGNPTTSLGPASDAAHIGFPFPRPGPTVLTPHPGEFARMLGTTTAGVQANRAGLAREFAARFGVVLLLKGHRTIITDGDRLRGNETGNPGMATGGCGDVLTGLIAGLMAQGLSAFDAACLGAWVHGRAGDLAAGDLSQVALTAADLLDYLPLAIKELMTNDE